MDTPLVPFQSGSPIMISGPTKSGKTVWTHKLITNNMLTQPIFYIVMEYTKNIMMK